MNQRVIVYLNTNLHVEVLVFYKFHHIIAYLLTLLHVKSSIVGEQLEVHALFSKIKHL